MDDNLHPEAASRFLTHSTLPDDQIFPIHQGLKRLLPELKGIEEASRKYQIGFDWQTSPSFRDSLWRGLKEEFNISSSDVLDIRKGVQRRIDEADLAVYSLKSLISLLDVLKAAAEDVLTPVETELSRAGHTFGCLLETLPEELLALTMTFACQDVYDLIPLSHVNRRFRTVAISIPGIWASDVHSSMHPELLRLCLERSKNAPLRIDFDVYNEDDNFYHLRELLNYRRNDSRLKTYLIETAKRCSRWKALKFKLPRADDGDVHGDSYIFHHAASDFFKNIHVPQLRTLSLFHHGCLPDMPLPNSVEEQNREMERINFYRSWKAPNLRSITFSGFVPIAIPGASIETLYLDLRVQRKYMDFSVALQGLHAFLQETPTLRRIAIWSYTSGVTTQSLVRDFSRITLNDLEDLTLTLDEPPVPLDNGVHFSSLAACLRLPALSYLAVKIALASAEDTRPKDVSQLVKSLIPRHGGETFATDFSLYVYDPAILESRAITRLDLGGFSSLKTLTVGVIGQLVLDSQLHPNVMKNGSLEEISLLFCIEGSESFLNDVVHQLYSGDGLRNLKTVAVRKGLSESVSLYLKSISDEKLVFGEREDDEYVDARDFSELGYYTGHTREELGEF